MGTLGEYWIQMLIGGMSILVSPLVAILLHRRTNSKLASAAKEREARAREFIRSILEHRVLHGSVPPPIVLEAMLSAVARKYELQNGLHYGIEELRQDVVLSMMGSELLEEDKMEQLAVALLEEDAKPDTHGLPTSGSEYVVPKLHFMLVLRECVEFSIASLSLATAALFGIAATLEAGTLKVGFVGAGAATSLLALLNLAVLIPATLRVRIWTAAALEEDSIEFKDGDDD